jgi:choline-glycine betaine transporter
MALREFHWLLFWAMLGGVACFTTLALSRYGDIEAACEMGRAAHLLASVVLTAIIPKLLQA